MLDKQDTADKGNTAEKQQEKGAAKIASLQLIHPKTKRAKADDTTYKRRHDPDRPFRNRDIESFIVWCHLKKKSLAVWLPVFISAVVLVVIIAQSVIYKRQLDAMFSQGQTMQDTLTEMRTSRELENRAWIGVKSIEAVDGHGGVTIKLTFINGGNSPAIVTMKIEGKVRYDSPPDDFQFPPFETMGSSLTLFPGQEYVHHILLPGKLPVFAKPATPDHAFYLYGDLDYDDTFKRRHTTKFCYRTSVVSSGERPAPSLSVCPTHSTFD